MFPPSLPEALGCLPRLFSSCKRHQAKALGACLSFFLNSEKGTEEVWENKDRLENVRGEPLRPAPGPPRPPGGCVAASFRGPAVPTAPLRKAVAAGGWRCPPGRPGRRAGCSGWGVAVPLISGPGAQRDGEASRCCRRSPAFGGSVELVKLLRGCGVRREPRLLPKLLRKGGHCLGFLELVCSCCRLSFPRGKGTPPVLRADF